MTRPFAPNASTRAWSTGAGAGSSAKNWDQRLHGPHRPATGRRRRSIPTSERRHRRAVETSQSQNSSRGSSRTRTGPPDFLGRPDGGRRVQRLGQRDAVRTGTRSRLRICSVGWPPRPVPPAPTRAPRPMPAAGSATAARRRGRRPGQRRHPDGRREAQLAPARPARGRRTRPDPSAPAPVPRGRRRRRRRSRVPSRAHQRRRVQPSGAVPPRRPAGRARDSSAQPSSSSAAP